MDSEVLGLANIGNGGLVEVFDRELVRVLENISDVNTAAERKRKIQVEITFKPYEDRSGAEIEYSCKAVLCGVPTAKSRMFIARKGNKVEAYRHDPRQLPLLTAASEGRAQ